MLTNQRYAENLNKRKTIITYQTETTVISRTAHKIILTSAKKYDTSQYSMVVSKLQ